MACEACRSRPSSARVRGRGQAAVPLLGELLATAEEVQVRQREGVGQVLVALAFQKPQQQGRQIGPHAPGRAGLAQQILQLAADLAAGDLAAQQGVVAVEWLVADRREEVEMAQQIGDAALSAGGDRPGTGRTQADRAPAAHAPLPRHQERASHRAMLPSHLRTGAAPGTVGGVGRGRAPSCACGPAAGSPGRANRSPLEGPMRHRLNSTQKSSLRLHK